MSITVPTSITIWQDLAGDQQWRIEFTEEAPGTRQLEMGPFDERNEACAWIQQAVMVPLPQPSRWVRYTIEGFRDEFWCHIQNEVPE
jgi:hypothetical protein